MGSKTEWKVEDIAMPEGAINYWSLKNSLENEVSGSDGAMNSFVPVVYANGGVYLENNYLYADMMQNHTSDWTIIFQYQPTKEYPDRAWIAGYTQGEGHYSGMLYANGGIWLTYSTKHVVSKSKFNLNEYNTVGIMYDVELNQLSCYINGECVTTGAPWEKDYTQIYFGGGYEVNKYTDGYYKNIAYYNRKLTEAEINGFMTANKE